MTSTKGFKAYMGLLITVGMLAMMAALLYAEPKPGARDALLIVIGAVVATVRDVYCYYFGSSEGSTRKTEIMEAANVPPAP